MTVFCFSPVPSAKRKGGVGSVLEMLNKKPKMSTLVRPVLLCPLVCHVKGYVQEEAKLDWMKYRQQEGLEDQLEQNKKDG